MTISTFNLNAPGFERIHERFRSIYKKAGIPLKLKVFPIARSILEANAGNVDGELFRVKPIGDLYVNLIRVPTSVFSARFTTYSLSERENPKVSDFEEGITGVLRGVKITEDAIPEDRCIRANSLDSLLGMLILARVDRVFLPIGVADEYLEHGTSKLSRIKKHLPPIMEIDFFHYLHKRHRDKIQKFDEIISSFPKLVF